MIKKRVVCTKIVRIKFVGISASLGICLKKIIQSNYGTQNTEEISVSAIESVPCEYILNFFYFIDVALNQKKIKP